MKKVDQIHESGEMYLETILELKEKKANVYSVDIVEGTGYSKSSVSKAVNKLKALEYITINPSGSIDFTEKGKITANKIFERHNTITNLLKSFGVSDEVAEIDACRIEHVISEETFEKIKKIVKNI